MKLTTVWLNRVEGIALMLILFSFFVQIFQNNSEESFRNSQNYPINKKLAHIWDLIEKEYSEEERAGEEQNDSPGIRLESVNKDWEMYSKLRL